MSFAFDLLLSRPTSPDAEQSDLLAGPIGILKMYCTRCAGEIADDAVQIFGGRGITQGGSALTPKCSIGGPRADPKHLRSGRIHRGVPGLLPGRPLSIVRANTVVNLQRTQKFDALLGGAEEGTSASHDPSAAPVVLPARLGASGLLEQHADIWTKLVLGDLGVRQASRKMPKAVL